MNFLKEHRKVQELECRAQKQEATITQQQNEFKVRIAAQLKQIDALASTLHSTR